MRDPYISTMVTVTQTLLRCRYSDMFDVPLEIKRSRIQSVSAQVAQLVCPTDEEHAAAKRELYYRYGAEKVIG